MKGFSHPLFCICTLGAHIHEMNPECLLNTKLDQ